MNQPVSDKFPYKKQKNINKVGYYYNGYVALVSVLIVGIVALSITTSVILLGLGSSRTGFVLEQTEQARGLATACAERALDKLRKDLNYTGNETITLGQGSCQIRPVLGSGNTNRTIETTGTVGTIVKKVKVIIAQVTPQTQLTSWQEVNDF